MQSPICARSAAALAAAISIANLAQAGAPSRNRGTLSCTRLNEPGRTHRLRAGLDLR